MRLLSDKECFLRQVLQHSDLRYMSGPLLRRDSDRCLQTTGYIRQ